MGGLGLGSIEVEQMIEAYNLFIILYLSLTPSTPLLKDSLELMQIETRLDSLVFEENYSDYRYLVTRGWLQSLWESLLLHSIKLHVLSYDFPISLRMNNIVISRKVVRLKFFSKKELYQINVVRLAFQVIFLLELVDVITLQVKIEFTVLLEVNKN